MTNTDALTFAQIRSLYSRVPRKGGAEINSSKNTVKAPLPRKKPAPTDWETKVLDDGTIDTKGFGTTLKHCGHIADGIYIGESNRGKYLFLMVPLKDEWGIPLFDKTMRCAPDPLQKNVVAETKGRSEVANLDTVAVVHKHEASAEHAVSLTSVQKHEQYEFQEPYDLPSINDISAIIHFEKHAIQYMMLKDVIHPMPPCPNCGGK